MNNILIINLDQNYRSAYSVLIALALDNQFKLAEITLITSSDNEIYESLELFKNIHRINPGGFLNKVKSFSSTSLEREIKIFLMPVLNTKWDLVLNLTSNRLGAIFCSFLRSNKFAGPCLTNDLEKFEYDCFSSYHLSTLTEENRGYFHPLYLYKEILNNHRIQLDFKSPLAPFRNSVAEEKFKLLRTSSEKKYIVLLDLGLEQQDKIHSINFLVNLHKEIQKSEQFVPVLITKDVSQESFVINKLRDNSSDDIFLIEYDAKGIIPTLLCVDIFITGDHYLMALSDICDLKTIMISEKEDFNFSEASIKQDSLTIKIRQFNSEVINSILGGISFQVNHKMLEKNSSTEVFVARTNYVNDFPQLLPLVSSIKTDSELEKLICFLIDSNYLLRLNKKVYLKNNHFAEKLMEQVQLKRLSVKESFNRFLKAIKSDISDDKIIKNKIQELCAECSLFAIGIAFKLEFIQDGTNFTTMQFLEVSKDVIKDIFEYLSEIEEHSHNALTNLKP